MWAYLSMFSYLFLGVVLTFAAVRKVGTRAAFELSLTWLPTRIVRFVSRSLPLLECIVGVGLLIPSPLRAPATEAALGLTILFAGYTIVALLTRTDAKCACFGRPRPVTQRTLARNLGLVAIAAIATGISPVVGGVTAVGVAVACLVLLGGHARRVRSAVAGGTTLDIRLARLVRRRSAKAVIFTRSGCPACELLLETLERSQQMHGYLLVVDSSGGQRHHAMPLALSWLEDDGSMARRHGVVLYPSAVAVDRPSSGTLPMAVGPAEILTLISGLTAFTSSPLLNEGASAATPGRDAGPPFLSRRGLVASAATILLAGCTKKQSNGSTTSAPSTSSQQDAGGCATDTGGITPNPVNEARPGTCTSISRYREVSIHGSCGIAPAA